MMMMLLLCCSLPLIGDTMKKKKKVRVKKIVLVDGKRRLKVEEKMKVE